MNSNEAYQIWKATNKRIHDIFNLCIIYAPGWSRLSESDDINGWSLTGNKITIYLKDDYTYEDILHPHDVSFSIEWLEKNRGEILKELIELERQHNINYKESLLKQYKKDMEKAMRWYNTVKEKYEEILTRPV